MFEAFVERGDDPSSHLSQLLPLECNTPDDVIYEHIKGALERKLPIIQPIPPHAKVASLVGGGPSAKHDLGTIGRLENSTIFALNGAGLWLQKSGIVPDALIILDARPHNAKFITGLDKRVHCYLATQCHPEVFAAAEHNGNPIITWHAANDEVTGIAGIRETRATVIIGAGTSVGMRALRLVHVLGYRSVHLFGYDSSFENGEVSHSYPQAENEADKPRGCMVGGRWFVSTPWMIRQADDFQHICAGLMVEGMTFHVHGDGLLPEVARQMNIKQPNDQPRDPALLIDETAQIHPYAHIGHDVKIGARTRVWQFASVIRGTVLGEDCNVASCATLDGPHFGDRCIICQGVAMGPGFLFGNDVFVGPNVTVCNDAFPRTDKAGFDIERLQKGEWAVIVKDGASIGANAVVVPGVTIGARAMVAAGSVVTRSIPDDHFWHRDGRISKIDTDYQVRRMRIAQQ